MFDITYLGGRCFRFIKRYPRTFTIVGFLLIFGIGIWVGREVPFEKIPDYFKSYTDPERSDETKQVLPGIVHRQILDDGVLTNILSVAPDAVDIRPYRALSAGIGTESLPSIARRHKAPIAINGGFFEMGGTFRGESVGALKINGEWMSEPEQGRGVVGFKTVDGKIETYMDRIVLQHEVVLPNETTLKIDGINRGRLRNELVLYRPHFHSITLTMADGVEVVVRNGEVVDIHDGKGSTHIPADGYILSANGWKRVLLLKHIALGDSVEIREKIIPERVGDNNLWVGFTHIISGGPLLLRNGVISTTEAYKREGFDASFHSFWHPRTAVGKKADGTLLFVTITAAKLGVRRGVTLQQLAKLFVEWGATDAVNLDGGYSSMMIIRNQVVSFKRTQRDRSQSGDKSKPTASEKQPEKNMKPSLSEKKTEKDAKPAVSVKKPDKNAKQASPEKQQPQKATPEKNTRTARGNRRVRPMPTFQGRSISDAILIFPRSPAKSK
ncbi:MAG: phosphodiester glycosidase family protein [Candidatus Poribacteria bacterium]|nr:phosphodiester glycosidase family protein [Candidatus Poribacteria bacterium]